MDTNWRNASLLIGFMVIAVSFMCVIAGCSNNTRPGIGAKNDMQIDPGTARPPIGEEHLITESGSTIAYYTYGEGDTVVLLASAGRSVSDFNELAVVLANNGYRTMAVESRGVGKSSLPDDVYTLHDLAKDARQAVGHSGVINGGRVHLVGHAFGNRVARTFASDYPDLSQSLTLLVSGGRVKMSEEAQDALRLCFFLFLSEEVRRQHIRTAFFAPPSEIPDYWIAGWYPKAAGKQGTAKFTPLEEWWNGGVCPILILQGEDDPVAPPGNASAMKQEFPDRVTVVMVPDASHALLPEQPAIIEKELLAFLTKVKLQK